MTLLITIFAAIVCTMVWYKNAPEDTWKTSILCLTFWGASLMWLVDGIVEYMEMGTEFFMPAPSDMLNDLFLGFSVVALGLILWLVVLFIKDPQNIIKGVLLRGGTNSR